MKEMYVVISEGDAHVSEDGWQTVCEHDVESDAFLYEVSRRTILDSIRGEDAPGLCEDCCNRVEQRVLAVATR